VGGKLVFIMSTSSTPSVSSGFTGTSSFSSSLAQVITRAVAFQQLPITQLQNQQSTLTDQQTEVQTLGSDFSSLQNALTAIGTATGSSSYAASSSADTVATASLGSGVQAGTYAITVTAIGAQTNTVSSNGLTTVSNPSSADISTSTAFTLTAAGGTYQISNSANTLSGLAAAINASGAPVQATLVNVGGSAAPDYRLSVQGTQYASSAIQLNDGTSDLLTTLTTGSNVAYQINGLPAVPVTSTSRNLAISPGVTINVLAVGSASITVSQNADAIASAFSSFATSYNTAVDEVVKNRGQNGGALAGSSVLLQLSSALSSLGSYSGPASGSINSLADLGLSFDLNGHLQFDSGAFASATSNSVTAALSFLGSKTGGGFLQAANSALAAVTDPTTGVITQETNSIATSLTTLSAKISTQQTNLAAFQTNLTNQMAQADALIASLEQQTSEITSLFAAQQTLSKSISG
jgi:flagellar hook-associated protein 2